MATIIRRAIIKDIPKIVEMLQGFILIYKPEQYGIDYDKTLVTEYYNAVVDNPIYVILIAEVDGEMAGTVGAVVAPWFHINPKLTIGDEIFWWVEPKYRGSGKVGIQLIKECEKIVLEMGAVGFVVSSPPGDNSEAVEKYYLKSGYTLIEKRFGKKG